MHTGKKLNCLIIDDEPMAQEVLISHINNTPALQVTQVCNNAIEAFEALHKNHIDLIFLDINMPVISGLNFLRSLKDPPAVIFTTAYPEYAVDGFELDAADYLLKPVSYSRFLKAVTKATEIISRQEAAPAIAPLPQAAPATNTEASEKNYFFVKADGKLVKLRYADVLYIEGMKDYLKIYTSSGNPIVTHQTLKNMEELLPAQKFMRVHKSFIVSLDAIHTIDGNMIHIGKAELPVGATYRESLLAAIAADNK